MTSQTKARTRVRALKDESCGGTVAYRMHVMARDVGGADGQCRRADRRPDDERLAGDGSACRGRRPRR